VEDEGVPAELAEEIGWRCSMRRRFDAGGRMLIAAQQRRPTTLLGKTAQDFFAGIRCLRR
jgi:hypothetical protein